MIRVTVALHSAIHPSRSRLLARLDITNDGTGTQTRGNYNAVAYGPSGRVTRRVRVTGYPRKAVSVWRLVLLCVAMMLSPGQQVVHWGRGRDRG